MSQFKTVLAVDVEGTKKLLPAQSFIEGITWNAEAKQVELVWSNHKLVTPYNIPVDFTLEQLQKKDIPAGVKLFVPKADIKQASALANDLATEFPTLAKGLSEAQTKPETQPEAIADGMGDVTVTDNVKPVDTRRKRGVNKPQT